MELEQLVSFVRYQRGQKTGWDVLDEVLTVVLESKDRVSAAQALADTLDKQVESSKAALAALDQQRVDKLAALDVELQGKRDDFETPLKNAKDALGQEIETLKVQTLGALKDAQAAQAEADAQKLNLSTVLDQVKAAEAALAKAQQDLAAFKASL